MKSQELNRNLNEDEVKAIKDAIDNEDSEALARLQLENFKKIENKVTTLFNELKEETDEKVLASRGVYQLTTEEKAFYDKLFKNAVGMSPTEGGTLLIPKTIVQRVFEDMQSEDEGVLDLIDFVNTTGASEWLVSTAEKPVATWGEICESITKELSVGFKVVNTLVNKLSCYIPYCRSLIDLGYSWQDLYVREYLSLGISSTLSIAAVSGNGTKQPWGMAYDYDIDDDTATIKTATKMYEFSRKSFAPLLKTIAINPMGFQRSLRDLYLIVDPATYYQYVYPFEAAQNANGVFVSVLEQLGIKVRVTDTGLTAGQAILGLPRRYFMEMAFAGNANGQITFSDDVLFLDDKRVYKAKTYADGFPKDNNAFQLLDLTTMGTDPAAAAASLEANGVSTQGLEPKSTSGKSSK